MIYEVSSSVLNVTELPFVDLYAYKKYLAGNSGHEIRSLSNIKKIHADIELTFHTVSPNDKCVLWRQGYRQRPGLTGVK